MVLFLILVLVISCLCKWWKQRKAKERKSKAKALLHDRLLKNWSALLSSANVDGLSHMPEEWKSGIVPCRSEIGRGLKRDMQEIGKQVENISNRCWVCGNKMEEKLLLDLKKSIEDFMQEKVAVFFEQRHEMYKLYLLENPKENKPEQAASGNPTSQSKGPASYAVHPEQKSETDWPENTTPLFKQIMFLLRDLDDMFKASYNQRFDLRILDSEMQQWTEWTQNEFPKYMPEKVVLRQSTPDVYDLYRQAAELHAYYDSVFESIAKATKAEWIPSSLKKLFRILEKSKHTRKGDHVDFNCSKVFDIVRGTLVYDTLGDNDGGLLRGVAAAAASKKFQLARLKDRFSNPTSACWRDVLLNGRMITSDGTVLPHLVEVQFHQRDLREERMNVGGHFIYERHRALFEACESACGNEAGDMLEEMHFISAREPIVNDLSNGRNSFIKKLASFGSPRRASS